MGSTSISESEPCEREDVCSRSVCRDHASKKAVSNVRVWKANSPVDRQMCGFISICFEFLRSRIELESCKLYMAALVVTYVLVLCGMASIEFS